MNRLREIWTELRASPASDSSGLTLRLVDARSDVRLFAAAKGAEGRPAVLVELPSSIRPLTFPVFSTRAFEVSAPKINGLATGRWAVVIELTDPAFIDLFDVLANELLTAV